MWYNEYDDFFTGTLSCTDKHFHFLDSDETAPIKISYYDEEYDNIGYQ